MATGRISIFHETQAISILTQLLRSQVLKMTMALQSHSTKASVTEGKLVWKLTVVFNNCKFYEIMTIGYIARVSPGP